VSYIDNEVGQAMQPGSSASAVGVAEVTHDTIREQLSDYAENSLSDGDRARVDEHLSRCHACRAYEATLRATTHAVGSLPREKAPDSARERLLQIPGSEPRP
jgi:anti-sigma factor RsiW